MSARTRISAVVLLALAALSGLSSGHAASSTYTVVDLGSFAATGDATSACADVYDGGVQAINAEGMVTGQTGWGDKPYAAFRATNGTVKRLKGGKGGGIGQDINSSGQVAGSVTDKQAADLCDFSGSRPATHAATWVGGTLTLLPVDDAEQSSQAVALNDDGIIVGWATISENLQPLVWRDGVVSELPLPEGVDGAIGAVPVDINADGQIIGFLQFSDFSIVRGVLWDGDEATMLPEGFQVNAINDEGTIIGSTNEGTRAAWIVKGKLKKLPGSPDDAARVRVVAINADQDVVGYTQATEGIGNGTPVLWRDGEAIDAQTLLPDGADLSIRYLADINDTGMIAAGAVDGNGEEHGIVLVPAES